MPAKVNPSQAQIDDMVSMYVGGKFSTRDVGKKYGLCANTVNRLLKEAGVTLSAAAKISQKMTGKPGGRLGMKNSEETRRKISANSRRKPTTLGKVYSEAERRNISEGIKKYYRENPKPKKAFYTPSPAARRAASVRSRCKAMLRRILVTSGQTKNQRTTALLGYGYGDLKAHIESMFEPGMGWDKRNSFHIDHIIPIAWFVKNGITDPAVINALSNLRPMWPQDNQKKSASVPDGLKVSGKTIYINGLVA